MLSLGDNPLTFSSQYGPHLQSPHVIVGGSLQFVSFLEYSVIRIYHLHKVQSSLFSLVPSKGNALSSFYQRSIPASLKGYCSLFPYDLRSNATIESVDSLSLGLTQVLPSIALIPCQTNSLYISTNQCPKASSMISKNGLIVPAVATHPTIQPSSSDIYIGRSYGS